MSKQLTAEEIDFNKAINALALELPKAVWDSIYFKWEKFKASLTASQPADAVEGKGVEVYEALYTPMTWESASCTLSIHFSEAGAKKAIEWHKKENDYNSEFQSYNIVKTKILP